MSLLKQLIVCFVFASLSIRFVDAANSLLPYHHHGHEGDDDTTDYTSISALNRSATMPFARSDMTANSIRMDFGHGYEERIYLIGGCIQDQQCNFYNSSDASAGVGCICPKITNACNYFDPLTETWHDCAPVPRNRYRHVSAVIDNKIYIAGGRQLSENYYTLDELVHEIDVYDPATNSWSTPFNWTDPYSDGAAFGYDGTLYLVGGYDYYYSETLGWLVSLDVNSGDWNFDLPKMNVGRGDISLVSFGESKVYVLGGFVASNFCNASNVMESYDVSTNTWTIEKSMIYARGDAAAGTMGNNIFAIAGETKDPTDPSCTISKPVPYVSRYNLLSDKWQIEASIPAYGSYYNSSNGFETRAIYLFGGQGSYRADTMTFPVRNTTYKYVPLASDFESDSSEPPLSKGGIAGVVIAGFVVLVAITIFVFFYCRYYGRGYQKAGIELSQQGDRNELVMLDEEVV